MSTPTFNGVALTTAAARQVVGAERIDHIARPSMGSEDFADFLKLIPGVMFRLGSAPPSGRTCQLHTPNFDIDERALTIGTRILARAAILYCRPSGGSAPRKNHLSKIAKSE